MSRVELVTSSVRAGFGAGRMSVSAAIWTWIAVLLVSLPLASAVGALVHQTMGTSLRSDLFAEGLDAVHLAALIRVGKPVFATFLPIIVSSILLWAVLSTFLTGATIAALSRGAPTSTHELFTGSGRVFGRLMRLNAFGIPFWCLTVGLTAWGASKGLGRLTEGWISEKAVLFARLIGMALVVAVAGWASSACDLMRVEAVSRGEQRARWAFVRGLGRAVSRPISAACVVVPFGALSLCLSCLGLFFDVRLGRGSVVAIVLGFVLEQGLAFARAWLRVAMLGAEVSFAMRSSEGARRAQVTRERTSDLT